MKKMYRYVQKKKWKKLFTLNVKDAKQSYLPILLIEWVLGLRVLECPLGRKKITFTIIYVLILWTLLPYLMFMGWSYLYSKGPTKTFFDPDLNEIVDSSNVLATIIFVIAGCLNSSVKS